VRVTCYTDTDMTLVEFTDSPPVETRELDENTSLDQDADGRIVSLTIEQCSADRRDG
jgi:Protein of unknown function (DUF2283).